MQVELPGVKNVEGLHVKDLTLGCCEVVTVMLPPEDVVVMPEPVADVASAPVTPIDRLPAADGDSVSVTTATTPFEMVFTLIPVSRHRSLPALLVQ